MDVALISTVERHWMRDKMMDRWGRWGEAGAFVSLAELYNHCRQHLPLPPLFFFRFFVSLVFSFYANFVIRFQLRIVAWDRVLSVCLYSLACIVYMLECTSGHKYWIVNAFTVDSIARELVFTRVVNNNVLCSKINYSQKVIR